MGIFDKIKSAIWGGKDAAAAAPTTIASTSAKPATASATAAPSAPAPAPKTESAAPAPAPTKAPAPASAGGAVDVAAILDAAVKASGQKLDWKKSIVDLMKALKLDSSIGARKELADELGYTGDKNDSAKMNVWLHKQVIQKLKDNGGKVPADLL
ncbi:DUF3597 domain-containing protein [Mesorhizobium sp. YM1C-6-2]|uniref:DUF3597 domain-containing protein n=1 Tax=Mesorhizobium sp. YM1C-6-2 TaxID=1827501 RepID=UPI000EF1F70F|nr:DUF3597 domain-containing protein [Mesorhizobium sp. YM1C-6-2]RLP22834.1 DUF3597 domain-containing protein [Mesorhizobium sp. YM1C-6-2]